MMKKTLAYAVFLCSSLSIVGCTQKTYASTTNLKEEELALAPKSTLSRQDYFDIACAIAQKPGGKKLILKTILRDHSGKNPDKSAFYSNDESQLSALIGSVVTAPSYCDFSRSSGRLMIIKDFDAKEIPQFSSNKNYIGFHLTPKKERIESNRVTLFFGDVEKIVEKGKPWDGKLGVLLTGFPDNPHRPY